MELLRNKKLQGFYKKAEFDREHKEVKEIEQRVRSLVDEIAEKIGRKDRLFKNFVIPSGSFYEDLKVERPDEFDFMICLKKLSKPGVCVKKDIPLRPVPDPGYVHVQVAKQADRWRHYISRRGNLRPDVLLQQFKHLIEEAMNNRKRWSQEKIVESSVEVELRKIPVTIKFTWKVERPDEFDFMICLKKLSKPGVCVKKDIPLRPVPDPGYVHVQVAKQADRWRHYISRRGNLRPDVLLQQFKHLIEEAMNNRKRWSQEKIVESSVEVELRKIPVTIKFTWNGTKYTNYKIAVDLTLCIKMSGWPDASNIQKRVKRGHPGYEVFRRAIQEGHHLVASTIGESGKPRPCWRLSFSVAEGIILKSICKDPKRMHKVVLKVLKVLRKEFEEFLCLFERPDGGSVSYRITWAFHSYVLKTMFLHEWTEFPEDSYWTKDRLGERVTSILERIRKSVIDKNIRSFWVPDYKLFNFQARNATDTKSCVDNLTTLLDELKL